MVYGEHYWNGALHVKSFLVEEKAASTICQYLIENTLFAFTIHTL